MERRNISGNRDRRRVVVSEEPISVVPASIEHLDSMSALFARSAGVNGCWCMWPLRAPRTHEANHDRNKAEMRSLLLAREPVGLIAIRGGQAVGWCACGPRSRYPQYKAREQGSRLWAIPCLYINPESDRECIAKALIEAATEQAKQHGATAIEGPPPW